MMQYKQVFEKFDLKQNTLIYLSNYDSTTKENFNKYFIKQRTQIFFKSNLNKRNTELFFKKTAFEKFKSFFLKKGKSKKAFRALSFSFYIFLNNVYFDCDLLKKNYTKYDIFLSFFNVDPNLNNYNFLLNFFFEYLTYSFFFRTQKLPIFLKKKMKKKYAVVPIVISVKNRFKNTLRYLYCYFELQFKFRNFKHRMLLGLTDIALNYTDSYFYSQKIIALKKVIKYLKK